MSEIIGALTTYGDGRCAVFNPKNLPLGELPVIFVFVNSSSPQWYHCCAIAQDGNVLGGHICSHPGYMWGDLGAIEGIRDDRHKGQYQVHYPDGYRMAVVPHGEEKQCPLLLDAFEKNKALPQEPEPKH